MNHYWLHCVNVMSYICTDLIGWKYFLHTNRMDRDRFIQSFKHKANCISNVYVYIRFFPDNVQHLNLLLILQYTVVVQEKSKLLLLPIYMINYIKSTTLITFAPELDLPCH